jgi:hypothetical protein
MICGCSSRSLHAHNELSAAFICSVLTNYDRLERRTSKPEPQRSVVCRPDYPVISWIHVMTDLYSSKLMPRSTSHWKNASLAGESRIWEGRSDPRRAPKSAQCECVRRLPAPICMFGSRVTGMADILEVGLRSKYDVVINDDTQTWYLEESSKC